MAKKQNNDNESTRARYEFRVWGKHRSARKALARMASEEISETVEDCYLLADDPSVNAKVRDGNLKIKQLVSERKGFERWASDRHRSADTPPAPFDQAFEDLRLDRPVRGKSFNLRKAVRSLDPDSGVRPVFVTKHRRLFVVGSLHAEATDIEIEETGETLHTLLIEGDDLGELVALRKKLGLRGEPNIAVHEAISSGVDS